MFMVPNQGTVQKGIVKRVLIFLKTLKHLGNVSGGCGVDVWVSTQAQRSTPL